jgi:hypothetical protein
MRLNRIIRVTAAVLACSTLAVAAHSQAASGGSVGTHFIVITQLGIEKPYSLAVVGRVQAKKHKCITHRRVVMYFNRADKRHLRDSGWSSRHGTIGLRGRWHAVPRRVIVKVRRKRVVTPTRSYTCSRVRFTHLGLTR